MSGETDWSGWTAQAYHVLALSADQPLPKVTDDVSSCMREQVAGWVKGALGLDYRPFHWEVYDNLPEAADPWCWVLTHLPSGWGMIAFAMVASEARALADEIAAMADWASVTPATSVFLRQRMADFFAKHHGTVFQPRHTIAPCARRASK